MKKDNLLFGLLGILIGAIIGFWFANTVNKSELPVASAQTDANTASAGNPALPPDHPPIGTGTGAAQNQGAAIQQVSAAIEKAKNEPQNYEAQMTAADLYYQIQRYDEAAKFYEAAAKIKPDDTEPLVKAGNAYFDGEKYDQAEKWYLAALEKDPKDITVRTDLGLSFFLREPRDINRAIKEYKASLAIDPKHEITLQNLAAAYKEAGDKENYDKTIAALKAVNPDNPILKK